ncbi:MFS transporter [Streptomyces sp. NPDC127036]|uniref:MFS transporter n=1 Tax=Streptomyces sp. NPDC127036 TaxID=3347112 RepID=UPI00365A956E
MLVGGVVADRLSRARMMVWSNVVCAAAEATAVLLLISGAARVWHLVATSALCGAAGAFFTPAAGGVVVEVVPAELRHAANALLKIGQNLVKVAGPALGGVLVAVVGPGWALGWDAVTFAASAVLFSRISLKAKTVKVRTGFTADLREGWDDFRSRRWLWVMVCQAASGDVAEGPVLDRSIEDGPAAPLGQPPALREMGGDALGAQVGDGVVRVGRLDHGVEGERGVHGPRSAEDGTDQVARFGQRGRPHPPRAVQAGGADDDSHQRFLSQELARLLLSEPLRELVTGQTGPRHTRRRHGPQGGPLHGWRRAARHTPSQICCAMAASTLVRQRSANPGS